MFLVVKQILLQKDKPNTQKQFSLVEYNYAH